MRDGTIWLAMYEYRKHWKRHRNGPVCVASNRIGERRTALSEIVAEAILGNRNQYKTVERVWTEGLGLWTIDRRALLRAAGRTKQ